MKGEIELHDVEFTFPSRMEYQVKIKTIICKTNWNKPMKAKLNKYYTFR